MRIPHDLNKTQLPIGVFDSGMGGLTVLCELTRALPNESFIYLGDTARLPYGTKSAETVRNYAKQMASILIAQQIKLLVVACNTATAAALTYLIEQFPLIPIVGVIESGAKAAIESTKTNNIAILATESTVSSQIYQTTIQTLNPKATVIAQSCGLFVALAEEGCVEDEIAFSAVKKYLQPIIDSPIPCDCVLLGCTHFPVLIKPIRQLLGADVAIVNSAKTTAQTVETALTKLQLRNDSQEAHISFLVTDLPERFIRIGKIFFQKPIDADAVQLVDVRAYPNFLSETRVDPRA